MQSTLLMSKTGAKNLEYVFSEIQYVNLSYILIINNNNDNFYHFCHPGPILSMLPNNLM